MNNYDNFDDYYEHNSEKGLNILNKKLDIENKELDLKQRKHEWIWAIFITIIVLLIIGFSIWLSVEKLSFVIKTDNVTNLESSFNSVTTSVSNNQICYLNGVKTNCSEIPDTSQYMRGFYNETTS